VGLFNPGLHCTDHLLRQDKLRDSIQRELVETQAAPLGCRILSHDSMASKQLATGLRDVESSFHKLLLNHLQTGGLSEKNECSNWGLSGSSFSAQANLTAVLFGGYTGFADNPAIIWLVNQ
jgi:hypothetical protein